MASAIETAWLEKARALAPVVSRYAEQGELERRLPPPVLQAVRDGGFLRMMLPRALGGEQTDLESALHVFEELARQDGSCGWNCMFAVLSPVFSDYIGLEQARDIFEGTQAIMVGSFAPSGKALPVDGGYRVSGRWGFGSCSHDADWLICGAIVLDDGQPRLGPNGMPETRLFYVPASEYQFFDTWHTLGMRGTGSNDFALQDAFVPEALSFPFSRFFMGANPRPGRGYPRPFMEIGAMCLASVALGIGRHAIEAFVELAATKVASTQTAPLSQQPIMHDRVGRAEAMLSGGRAFLLEAARKVMATPEDGPSMVGQARLAAVHASQSARTAVDLVYEAGGGTSIFQSSPLERCFRDINTATHHFLISPSAYAETGRVMLNPQA